MFLEDVGQRLLRLFAFSARHFYQCEIIAQHVVAGCIGAQFDGAFQILFRFVERICGEGGESAAHQPDVCHGVSAGDFRHARLGFVVVNGFGSHLSAFFQVNDGLCGGRRGGQKETEKNKKKILHIFHFSKRILPLICLSETRK